MLPTSRASAASPRRRSTPSMRYVHDDQHPLHRSDRCQEDEAGRRGERRRAPVERPDRVTNVTRFTELVGCRVPIQQAGMGGASTPDLAAAVSNAGGFGMLAATENLSTDIDATVRAAPDRGFGVNFLMPFFDRALLHAIAPRVRLVEWYWGWPAPVLVGVAHD